MKTTAKGTLACALSFVLGYGLCAEDLVNTISSADTILADSYEVDIRTTPSGIGYATGLYIKAPTYSAGLGENLTVTAVGDYDGDFWISHPLYDWYGSATAVAFSGVSGIGDINATLSATALGTYDKGYSFGLNLNDAYFAEGAQINAKIYSENKGTGGYVCAYGIYGAHVALADIGTDAVITVNSAYSSEGITLIYSNDTMGKMAGKLHVNSDFSATGINVGSIYQTSFDISGEVLVSGTAEARGIRNFLTDMTLNMSGNAIISAISDNPSYADAVLCGYALTINGDAGTQTFIGNIRAGRGIVVNNGNFVFGASHDLSLWKGGYGYSITISGDVSAKFVKSTSFEASEGLYLNGDIILTADSMADYVTLWANYTDVYVGEESTLTLILADDFVIPLWGELLLLEANGTNRTVTGEYKDAFEIYFANGAKVDKSKYILIENGTQVILQFVPEPSSWAAVFGAIALTLILRGRKNRPRQM